MTICKNCGHEIEQRELGVWVDPKAADPWDVECTQGMDGDAFHSPKSEPALSGPKPPVIYKTEFIAHRSTRRSAERYVAEFADECGDTWSYMTSPKTPVHVEWDVVPAGKGFDIISTVTPRKA